MAKRMLIDATHPEETRVVVMNGNKLEEFDHETAVKQQLKGNIYLAKVTRVEPSLQAAFVDYGGNRHGFLPFSEIHPDYYRIPVADREALLAEEAGTRGDEPNGEETATPEPKPQQDDSQAAEELSSEAVANAETGTEGTADAEQASEEANGAGAADDAERSEPARAAEATASSSEVVEIDGETALDTISDEIDDAEKRRRAIFMRHYKIQEVIKRRQVILVQVTKEERGTKGAALTTYLSLPGRYCVLMPNTDRGGGISRKIGSATDRRRLKSVVSELDVPSGMAVIVRTAGSERSKAEIRRDYEYLLRLWDEIRDQTMKSTAPALIYEEANLIKRAIRDLYSRDMEDILVEGDDGYKAAKAFMKNLMPSHARKVQIYKDTQVPLFHRYQVESHLDAMHASTVQLKSGGYIVLNPTEALVAIDVNSGKATRERHIEETALKTNLEASEEIARQLRLRDLAGLIVIDFIDMDEPRHNRDVERRLKEAMKLDRARIQLGRISPFGLLELSRQRLRPSLFESSMVICPQCRGSGHIRSVESTALHVLRGLEDEGIKRPGGRVKLRVATAVALYVLNQKRAQLLDCEQRYGFGVDVEADDSLTPPDYELQHQGETAQVRPAQTVEPAAPQPTEEKREEAAAEEESDGRRKRRRRRRPKGDEVDAKRTREGAGDTGGAKKSKPQQDDKEEPAEAETVAGEASHEGDPGTEQPKRKRRRGKRGGRRRSRRSRGEEATDGKPGPEQGYSTADDTTEEIDEEAAGLADEKSEPTATAAAVSEGTVPSQRQSPVRGQSGITKDETRSETSHNGDAREDLQETGANGEQEVAASPSPAKQVPEDAAGRRELTSEQQQSSTEESEQRPRRRGWWNRSV